MMNCKTLVLRFVASTLQQDTATLCLSGTLSAYPVQARSDRSSVSAGQRAYKYLVDCCKSTTDVASRQRLRSASRHQPRHRRTKFGRRAFSVAGPTAWNSLPDYLRDPSLSEDTFRRSLQTYLFALY